VQITKYLGASKRWHRGELRNIVAQQKMASRWIQKYRGATKRWHRDEHGNIVKQQKMASR